MKIIAVIPAYHEQERIAAAVKDAAVFVDAVVVIDDGSKDATASHARAAGAHVLRHAINRGQGAALQTGTDYALRVLDADVIVHFDADGQMQGSDIPMMVEPIVNGTADVTLGSRVLGLAVGMPFHRSVVAKAARVVVFAFTGLMLSDAHNGFRALSRRSAQAIRLTGDRMTHATEILDLIAALELRHKELPVTIRYTAETLAKGQRSSGAIKLGLELMRDKLMRKL